MIYLLEKTPQFEGRSVLSSRNTTPNPEKVKVPLDERKKKGSLSISNRSTMTDVVSSGGHITLCAETQFRILTKMRNAAGPFLAFCRL